MLTPYDWQEGIGNRAQYVEGKLSQGTPVLAVSLGEGILVLAYKRQARKIYEIYDRLIFAGLGQQSDVEALRTSAVDFAHQEGYNRSEQDVTVQRVVTALSTPLKKAFNDFSSSPVVARSLFAEVGASTENDLFYVLDFDGDYLLTKDFAVLAGTEEVAGALREKLSAFDREQSADDAVAPLSDIWVSARDAGLDLEDAVLGTLSVEAVLLERSDAHENRFRVLRREE